MVMSSLSSLPFFFNDTATTEIYTLSLHDALPIYQHLQRHGGGINRPVGRGHRENQEKNRKQHRPQHGPSDFFLDRKSTRLNSSHTVISYAVFCLEEKNRALGFAELHRLEQLDGLP